MAYGTPATRDDVLEYYTDIRRGRPPTDEQLADLVRRYDAIATPRPTALTAASAHRGPHERQAARSTRRARRRVRGRDRAQARQPEHRGRGHVASACSDVDRIVGLVLAPHYSAMSVGDVPRAGGTDGRRADDIGFSGIESWATEPAYVDFLVRATSARASPRCRPNTRWCSPPTRCPNGSSAEGDPYPDELRATATAVAAAPGSADEPMVAALAVGRAHA